MSTDREASSREAFEAEFSNRFAYERERRLSFAVSEDVARRLWQESRRIAFEEAAAVCEKTVEAQCDSIKPPYYTDFYGVHCAAAIRALLRGVK